MPRTASLWVDVNVTQSGNGLRSTTQGLQSLTASASAAGNALSGMLAPLGIAGGLSFAGAAAGLGALVKQGIQFNAQMETSRLGMAALIGAFGEVRDSSGRALNDFSSKLTVATELQNKLKVAALQTTAEYTDMVTALQVGLGPALKAGFNADQVVQFTKTVTQAASAIGLPMNQLGQEIRSLFAGDIGIDSRLANLLFTDIPRNKIKAYVEELQRSGKFYDEMSKRMSAFAQAGEQAQNTFSGALSNLKDAFNQALGQGTQDQLSTTTMLIRELTDKIVTFDDNGKAVFNQEFVSGINRITEAFVGLAREIASGVANLEGFLDYFGALHETWSSYSFGDKLRGAALTTFVPGAGQVMMYRDFNNRLDDNIAARRKSRRLRDMAREQRNNPNAALEDLATGGAAGTLESELRRRGLTLSGKSGSTATEPDKAREKAVDSLQAQLAAMRAQSHELDLQIRAAGTLDETKRKQLETEGKILGLLNQHGAFVRGLASQEKLTASERAEAARVHLQNTAKEIHTLRAQADRESTEAREKAHRDNVVSIHDYLEQQKKAGEELWNGPGGIVDTAEQATQDMLAAMRRPWEEFYGSIGAGMKRGLMAALDGGGIRGVFDNFFGSVFDTIGENFAKQIDSWTEQLALMAAGQKKTRTGTNPDGSPIYSYSDISGTRGQRNAQLGMIGLQGASALYGLYNSPAPTRGANMLTGAMAGASIGATYGAGAFSIPGALIGAFIGAIAGAFAPTVDGKNVRITGTGGAFAVSGLGSSGEWGVDKLQTSINSAIRTTAAKLDSIFTDLPTAVLEGLGAWRPDLTKIDVTGKGDGKNWNEELENYLRQSLPQRVIDAYMPAVFGALSELGVGGERLTQFAQLLGTQKAEEAIESINNYVDVLAGLQEIAKKFELAGGETPNSRRRAVGANRFDIFRANILREAEEGPLGEAGDLASRIAVLSQGFDDLTHDEQVARGQKILGLSQQLFGGIEQYLLRLTEMQRSMNESIDKQIRDINFDQLTDPKQQADFLLAEQRRLRDELGGATSEGDITRIVALMQQNAAELYTLLGRTPEAAAQAKQQLEDVRRIANERYEVIFGKAEKLTNDAFALVNSILSKLGQGLENLGLGGGTGGGGVSNPDDPTIVDPDLPWQKAGLAADLTASTFNDSLVPSIAAASAALQNLATGATMPQITVVCQHGPTNVDVQLAGTAEPLITSVRAGVTRDTLEAIERRAIRARSTGR